MKMTMIKYILPIILAMTMPAAAAPDRCVTSEQATNIVLQENPGAAIWHELKQVDTGDEDLEDIIIFNKEHDFFFVYLVKDCVVDAELVPEFDAVQFYIQHTKKAE